MDKKDVINQLIPADDLNWSDEEGGFTLLTMDELDDILVVCTEQGMSEDEAIKTVRWCEGIRAGQILWKNMLSGGIRVCDFTEDNEPIFVKNESNNA